MPKLYEAEKPKKMSQEKEVNLWQERIGISKKELERWSDDSGAKRFIKEYKNDYGIVFNTRQKKIPIPPINEVFAYVQSDIATTYARDPYIAVKAKAGSVKGAALWETNLNYWWRELKTKEELEYEIMDKDLVGYGFHKVGYDPIKDRIYSSFVSWKDIFWNVGAKRPPKDCAWMAERIVMPLDKIKKLYKNARSMEGSRDPSVDEDTYKKTAFKDDIKVGVIYEIWSEQDRMIYMVGEGLKDVFLDDPRPWPEYLDEFPFMMYWDFLVPGESRPMSAIAPWEAQILEEMILMGSAMNHAKRWNRQAFYNGGEIDENAMDKFERGDDGAIIRVSGKVGSDDLRFADFGSLPTDFYLLMDRIQAIKRRVNGQPEFVQGGTTKTSTRTIGELQMMQQGVRGRQERKIDRFETHCENISRHMMFNLKGNFDFETTIKITGDTPQEVIEALGDNYNPETGEIKFSPEEIEGEYDVEVKAGSTLPSDKQTRQQMMEVILQTVAPATATAPLSNFMVTLIGEILKDYDIKSLEEAYKADVAQAQEAKAQEDGEASIQTQKTLAEAEKRKAQAEHIHAETMEKTQEVAMGPVGRAQVERLAKDPLTPKVNGTRQN